MSELIVSLVNYFLNELRNKCDSIQDLILTTLTLFYFRQSKLRYYQQIFLVLEDPEVKLVLLKERGTDAVVSSMLYNALEILKPVNILDNDEEQCKLCAKQLLSILKNADESKEEDKFFNDLKLKSDLATFIRETYPLYSQIRLKYFIVFAPKLYTTVVKLSDKLRSQQTDGKFTHTLDEFLDEFDVKY